MSKAGTLEKILISIVNIGAGPKIGLGFRVDNLLHKFFKAIELSTILLHFGSNWGLQAFMEIATHCTFYKRLFCIKFEKDQLQIFEVSGPVLYQFILVLGVSLHFAPNTIYHSLKVFKILLEEIFKLRPGYWRSSIIALFVLKLLLSNWSMQKWGCK